MNQIRGHFLVWVSICSLFFFVGVGAVNVVLAQNASPTAQTSAKTNTAKKSEGRRQLAWNSKGKKQSGTKSPTQGTSKKPRHHPEGCGKKRHLKK